MLFGTWGKDKAFPPDDGRSTHKDYAGARFQRHLQAVDEIRAVAASAGVSVAQLCVGVLLATPGLTGVIAGARNARQGALIANLGVTLAADQATAVWAIAERLAKDLETM
jgi:aryl-alcohol dehydrogenase-like predicted oxidoreductase